MDKLRGFENKTDHRHTIRSSAGGTNLGIIDNKAKTPIKDNFLMTPNGLDLNASKSHILRSQESIEPQGSTASPPHYKDSIAKMYDSPDPLVSKMHDSSVHKIDLKPSIFNPAPMD